MRTTRLRLLVAVAGAGMLGGAFALQACGASDPAPPADSPDGASAEARDAAPSDASDRDPACLPDADLLAKVHDASIFDGASTTGVCLGCAKAKCDDAIGACTRDCACQGIVGRSLECYVTTQKLACAGALTNYLVTAQTRSDALRLLGCVQSECPVECVIDAGDAPDARDAAVD